jgi:hypothetical protein
VVIGLSLGPAGGLCRSQWLGRHKPAEENPHSADVSRAHSFSKANQKLIVEIRKSTPREPSFPAPGAAAVERARTVSTFRVTLDSSTTRIYSMTSTAPALSTGCVSQKNSAPDLVSNPAHAKACVRKKFRSWSGCLGVRAAGLMETDLARAKRIP